MKRSKQSLFVGLFRVVMIVVVLALYLNTVKAEKESSFANSSKSSVAHTMK